MFVVALLVCVSCALLLRCVLDAPFLPHIPPSSYFDVLVNLLGNPDSAVVGCSWLLLQMLPTNPHVRDNVRYLGGVLSAEAVSAIVTRTTGGAVGAGTGERGVLVRDLVKRIKARHGGVAWNEILDGRTVLRLLYVGHNRTPWCWMARVWRGGVW